MSGFEQKLSEVLGTEQVKRNESMARHTSFRAGGPAAYFVTPGNAEEVKQVVDLCKQEQIPYYVLGNGSNLLVSDSGYDGVILHLGKRWEFCRIQGDQVKAGAGTLLSKIASSALKASLTGFEFASGIPGSLGGAVVMNAGAYGGEMKDIVSSVRVLTGEGTVLDIASADLEMGYRTSVILKKQYIVLEAVLKLQEGSPEEIRRRMDELTAMRKSKQPLEYPSAGSTFKRPAGYYAGKLIEDAGLRGFQYKGAQVSEKHCGFVVNREQAAAADIMELCRIVQRKVKENSGVDLELEVKTLGSF